MLDKLFLKYKVHRYKKEIEALEEFSKHGRACETCKFYRVKHTWSGYCGYTERECTIGVKDVGLSTERECACNFYKIKRKFKKVKKGLNNEQ